MPGLKELLLGPELTDVTQFYGDPHVDRSIRGSSWFKPDAIKRIVSETLPAERYDGNLFCDVFLQNFMAAPWREVTNVAKYPKYWYLYNQLRAGMVTESGNTIPIGNINLLDEKMKDELVKLGIPLDLWVARPMIGFIHGFLQSLIAPKRIRNTVVKEMCGWNPGDDQRMIDVLAWSQVVRMISSRLVKEFK